MQIRKDSILIWSMMQELAAEVESDAVCYFAESIYKSAMTIDFAPFDNDPLIQIDVSVVPRKYHPDDKWQSDPHRENFYLLDFFGTEQDDMKLNREDAKAFLIKYMKERK